MRWSCVHACCSAATCARATSRTSTAPKHAFIGSNAYGPPCAYAPSSTSLAKLMLTPALRLNAGGPARTDRAPPHLLHAHNNNIMVERAFSLACTPPAPSPRPYTCPPTQRSLHQILGILTNDERRIDHSHLHFWVVAGESPCCLQWHVIESQCIQDSLARLIPKPRASTIYLRSY